MSDAASAILHTPWDCKWSRFARRDTRSQSTGGLWECIHSGERVVVTESDCQNCRFWEYQPPLEGVDARAAAREHAVHIERSARAVERGARLSLFVIAVIFAACGFVVLTTPLAVPLTISLWMGAAGSLMLGLWGNFRSYADGSFRGFLPPARD